MKRILSILGLVAMSLNSFAQTPTLNYTNGSITGSATRTFTVASAIANETPQVTNFSSSVYVKAVVSNMQNFRLTGSNALSISQPGMLFPNGYQNYRFASGNGRVYSLDFGGLADAYQTAPQGNRPSFPNMGTPYGVATVAAGDLVSDPSTHRIYLITSALTPMVVVGNPSASQSGDQAGSANSYALMNSPMTILPIPGQRNKVWVADKGNNKIKILNVETQITTDQVVNGVSLIAPVGLATDPTGNYLYVTDANRLIKIDLSNNNATVIAGATTAGDVDGLVGTSRLNTPMGIAVDRDGNIFIADKLNHKIKIYVPSAGKLVTIAGNGTAGDVLGQDQSALFNQPVAVLYDYGANTLQVSDYGNNKIKTLTFTTAYNITPILPNGLNFNKFTGVISGTPTLYTPLRNYTVTLDNGTGSAQIILPIQVLDIPPTNLNYSSSANIFTVGTTITNILPSNTGGVIASYSVYPTLPAGLTMSSTTGIISGTPTEGTVQTDYVITGTNTGGTITSTVSIYVQGPPYNMGYSRAQAVLVQNEPAYLVALPMSYPAATSYAMHAGSPTLPAGLSLNTTTGEITGTPTTISASTVYTIDVTNAFGTASGTVEIQVQAKPVINYVQPSSPYLQGTAISPLVPTLGGGTINAGLGGWGNTGVPGYAATKMFISYGTAPIRWYMMQGDQLYENNGGTARLKGYAGGAPDYMIMDPQYFFYNVSNASNKITKFPASNTSRIIKQWGAGVAGNQDGPAHLAKFNGIGQIAMDAIGSRIYIPDAGNKTIRFLNVITNQVSTIAGSGALGSSNGIGNAASFTNPVAATLGVDENLYILDLQSSNVAVIRKLNLTTFEVSNFVTLNVTPTHFLVTDKQGDMYVNATANSVGHIYRITRNGTVFDMVPSYTQTFNALAISPENGDVMVSPSFDNGLGYAYTPSESIIITPSLFDGLTFDYTNGTISGTASGTLAGVPLTTSTNSQTYTITASNRAGIFTTHVTLTVVRPPSGLTYQYAPWHILVGDNSAPNTINNANLTIGGLPAETYTVSPALPAGLSLNPSTGQITGTALGLSASQAYRVTATNAYGSTYFDLYIDVQDKPRPAYVGPQIYLKNNAITPLVPTNTGGAVLSPASINLNTPYTTAGNSILDMVLDANGNKYLIEDRSGVGYLVKLDNNSNFVSAQQLNFSPWKITLDGNTIYMTSTDYGAIDVFSANASSLAVSANPVYTIQNNGWGNSYKIEVYGGYIYVSSEDAGIWVIDKANYTLANHLFSYSIGASRITDFVINKNNGTFYIHDDNGAKILTGTYNPSNNTFTSTSPDINGASFSLRLGIDPAGNLYYADNGIIGQVSGGALSQIAGDPSNRVHQDGTIPMSQGQAGPIAFISPKAISIDNNGAFWVIDADGTSWSSHAQYLRKYEERVAYRISPGLPTGLQLDPQTGAISGTASVISSATNYTITAYNSVGSRSTNLNITVGAPLDFSYDYAWNTGINNQWGTNANPVFSGATFAVNSAGVNIDIADPITSRYASISSAVSGVTFSITPTLPTGLSLNTSTGVISGVPTAARNSTTYIITAVNAYGTSSATATFAITGPSNLSYGGNQSFINGIGASVSPQIGGVTGTITYAVTSGVLPAGVSLNTSTGILTYNGSGVAATASSVTITATGSTAGSASTTFNVGIGASGSGPSSLVYNNTITLIAGTAMSSITPSINAGTAGSGGVTYSISPNLNALTGLTFNPATGVISGTPSALAATTFTVTASTAYGSTSSSFSLQAGARPSALSYPNASYSFWRGDAIANLTPSVTNGTGATTFNAFGLPAGLTIDPISGTIYGIPSTAQAAGTATITASNTYGAAIYTISFAIIAPPTISYNTANSFTTSQANISLSPTIVGGYNNSVALNISGNTFSTTTGLSFNTSTGNITGTAKSTALATTVFTATISSTVNGVTKTANNSFNITIGAAPSSLSYTTPQVIALNNRIANLTPTITNGTGVVYTATGLPAGLNIDPNTGIIYGTAISNQSATNATITATNVYGSTQATISFAVGQAPSNLVFTPAVNNILVNSMSVNIPSTVNPGSGGVTYSVNPSLPSGFSLNSSTGVISGATSNITSANYVVTASNSYGSTNSIVQLATNNGPNFGYVRNHVYSAGSQIANLIPTIYYGAGSTQFSVSPSLPAGLSIDPLTGYVTGTPTAGIAVPLASYSVTGTNLFGTSNARLDIEIQGPPTNLNYGANIVQPINVALPAAIVPSVVASPAVATYSVSPALPAGLTFNPQTGIISGTPTVAQQAVTYTFSADNWIAPAATYSLTITVSASPIISYVSPQSFVVGTAISTLTPTVQNSVNSYSITPSLPAGLSFNTSNGAITGIPTSAITATNYTVTATNSFGSGSAVINIQVNSAPSTLSYTLNTNNLTTGIAIVNLVPNINTGTGTITYSVSPSLPAGLIINPNTGVISGTPTVASAAANYTITATNAYGSTTTYINFATGNAPSSLSYAGPNTFVAGNTITALTPTITPGTGTITYSVSPSLPAGLIINPNTGVISGTPNAGIAVSSSTYTITASNAFGSISSNVQIGVQGPPSNLTYSSSNLIFAINTPIANLLPSIVANPAPTYSVSPSLPSGLTLNPTTGAITGTPTAGQPATSYTITASNGLLPNTTFNITIAVSAAPIISYANAYTFTKNIGIGTITPTVTNQVNSWTINPALSTGLSFNTSTGAITGTPTTILTSTTYTVTATNIYGTATAGFSIQVQGPPSIPTVNNPTNTFVGNGSINIPAPLVTSNPAPVFSISPNLPAGLNLNSSTGAISGTPSIYSPLTNYVLTATNSLGSSTVTISFAILPFVAPITGANIICGNQPTQLLNATANGVWSSSNNAIATVSNSGWVTGVGANDGNVVITYTVTIGGISNATTYNLSYYAHPQMPVRLATQNTLANQFSILQARNGAASYEWSPATWLNNTHISNPSAFMNKETEYLITMTASTGCKTTDTLNVRVFEKNDILIPNVFSPNGDGVNDVLSLNAIGIKELRYFKVFNQWGKLIFETNDLNKAWDGTFNGILQPLASYNWIIDAIDYQDQKIQKAGTVTLLR